jgi:hypothetical protein
VASAHGAGTVGATEDASQHRVQLGVLGLFVGQDVLGKPPVDVAGKVQGAAVREGADGIGRGSYVIEFGAQGPVFGGETAGERGVSRLEPLVGAPRAERSEGVGDDSDVDRLLEDRASGRGQVFDRGNPHGG